MNRPRLVQAPAPDGPDLLTPTEVAGQLRITARTLAAWARDGRIAFVDLAPRRNGRAGVLRFRPEVIVAFVEAHEVKAGR